MPAILLRWLGVRPNFWISTAVATETLAMPVRLDNCHRLEDRRQPSIKLQKEERIAIRELDATAQLALQNAYLLRERRILGFKLKLRPEWQEQQSHKRDE